MTEAGRTPEQERYLEYISDFDGTTRVENQERIDAVDKLQAVINEECAIRIGEAVVGSSTTLHTIYELHRLNDSGHLGAAIIDGSKTKIAKEDTTVIGDGAVVVDCELTNSTIRRAEARDTNAYDSLVEDSTVLGVRPRWQGATQRSVLHKMKVVGGCELTYASLKNGTFKNVNGSTDGNLYPGSLRDTFIGYDTTTGTFKYS